MKAEAEGVIEGEVAAYLSADYDDEYNANFEIIVVDGPDDESIQESIELKVGTFALVGYRADNVRAPGFERRRLTYDEQRDYPMLATVLEQYEVDFPLGPHRARGLRAIEEALPELLHKRVGELLMPGYKWGLYRRRVARLAERRAKKRAA